MPKLPPQAQLARWAVKYGPLVAPYARRLYEHGRFRQLAIMHARTLVDGRFSWEVHGGDRVWVVWAEDEVVATYPDRPDLAGADGQPFPGARPERRQDPDDLPTQRARRRIADVPVPRRLPLGRRSDDADAGAADGGGQDRPWRGAEPEGGDDAR